MLNRQKIGGKAFNFHGDYIFFAQQHVLLRVSQLVLLPQSLLYSFFVVVVSLPVSSVVSHLFLRSCACQAQTPE